MVNPTTEVPISFVRRLLVATYLIEAGVLLILAPWTASWDRNYFGHMLPWLGVAMRNEFFRGGVSGLGLVTAIAGLRDLASALVARHHATAIPPGGTAPGGPGA